MAYTNTLLLLSTSERQAEKKVRSGLEIDEIDGVNFKNGQDLDAVAAGTAHSWYINFISGCGDSSVPIVIAANRTPVLDKINSLRARFSVIPRPRRIRRDPEMLTYYFGGSGTSLLDELAPNI
jgi:hypothetical protein